MMFSVMLTYAFQDCYAGFPIRYRFDGNVFNLRGLQAKSKVQTDVLDKLLSADDLTENAKLETKCNKMWIACHKHMTFLTLLSTQKILR